MADDEKKIFVDEDWKAQVQKEREEAARMAQEKAPPEGEAVPGGEAPEELPGQPGS
jgi:hypothetical protein